VILPELVGVKFVPVIVRTVLTIVLAYVGETLVIVGEMERS
jgi:hypothetical protein